jgi:tetratricopeptide (TPR) repeat protein
VAALHSFEYEVAEQQFQALKKASPGCGMAYWGEAMSLFHQLWSRPTAEELKRGADLLARAKKAESLDSREAAYVNALGKFYSGKKKDHDARVSDYSLAMGSLHNKYPRDTEASVFYALSLLAAAPHDDEGLKNERKAIEILNPLYDENPTHPGIAHYIIHSADNPTLASLGLAAARKYAALAPESPHAVHMPSHIFARLGLWLDDIKSNAAAVEVADKLGHLHMEHHKMHSIDFMHYAYLQIGDDKKAEEMAAELAKVDRNHVPEEFKDFRDSLVAAFGARFALERRQWKEALALKPDPAAHPSVQAITYLAHAIGAGHLRDATAAKKAEEDFNAAVEATKKSSKAYYARGMQFGQYEAQAWAKYAAGDEDVAAAILRKTADIQDKIGKSETGAPAREMLADMLLDAKRYEAALKEYEVSLKTDPNRFSSLYGAAQAAEALA